MSSPKKNVSPATPVPTPDPTQVYDPKPLPQEELKDFTYGEPENKVTSKAATTRQNPTPNSPADATDEATPDAATEDARRQQREDFAEEKFFHEVVAGTPLKEAAAIVGFSERTAQRRWSDPEFKERVFEARVAIRDEVLGEMTIGMKQAVRALRICVNNQDMRLKLSAARTLLRYGHHFAIENEKYRSLEETLKRMVAGEGADDQQKSS